LETPELPITSAIPRVPLTQENARPSQSRLEDYARYRRGEAAAVSPAVAEITGRPPTDVWQFARDYAPAFRG